NGHDVFRPAGIAWRAAGHQFNRLPRMPAEIRRIAARGAAESERQARARQPAEDSNESAARARFETRKRAGHYRHAAAYHRSPVRSLRDALLGRETST